MTTLSVEVAQRGQLTIPKSIRDLYNIKDGQKMTLVDLGNGSFIVSPKQLELDHSTDVIRDGLLASGATLEGMLADLRQRRESPDGE